MQNKLDFVPLGLRGKSDEDEEFLGMRNENLMRTSGNGDPRVHIANPSWHRLMVSLCSPTEITRKAFWDQWVYMWNQ